MLALAWRQVVAAVRLPAVWIATAVQVAMLTLYIVVWGDGIPLVGARAPFEQFATAQTILLLLVLPWVAARSAATVHRDTVTRLAVLTACRPSTVVLGACLGLAGVTAVVAATGMPLAIVSQQISALGPQDLAAAQLRLLALSACAATLTLAAVLVSGNRLAGWLLATALAALVTRVAPAGMAGALTIGAIAACSAAALAQRAERTWQHLAERRA
jgi:hypothetical protein